MKARHPLPLAIALAVSRLLAWDAWSGPGETGSIAEIRVLIKQGKYADAETMSRALLAEVQSKEGPGSLEAARAMDLIAECLWRTGRTKGPEGLSLAQRAVVIKETALGRDDPEVAASLVNEAEITRQSGDLAGARRLYERALDVRRRALGPDHTEVAGTLASLANILSDMAQYPQARALYEEALSIQRRALGPDDPGLAQTYNNLGILLRRAGDYAGARIYYERALEIRIRASGPESIDIARNLNGLGLLLLEMAAYEEAKPYFERAISIWSRSLGPENPQVAWGFNNLGVLLHYMGDEAGARSQLERALAIREKALRPDHQEVAQTLSALANVHKSTGDYETAISLLERSLKIREAVYGPDHQLVAWALWALSSAHVAAEEYAPAKPLLERALAIIQRGQGDAHPDYASYLDDLAVVVERLGDPAAARGMLERALAIRERVLGPEHFDVAETLNNLAGLRSRMDGDGDALGIYARALAIREKVLGPDHPKVAETLADLAGVCARLGLAERAMASALRSEEIAREHLRLTAETLSERQALLYAAARVSGLDLALDLASRSRRTSGADAMRVWESLARSRAVVLDEMARRHRTAEDTSDPEVGRLAAELATARKRLANLAVRGTGDLEAHQYTRLLDDARQERDRLERLLAQKSLAFRRREDERQTPLSTLLANLPPRSALVSFAMFRARAAGNPGRQAAADSSYVALVTRAGTNAPAIVLLGTSSIIEPLVSRWYQAASRGGRPGRRPAADDPEVRAIGESLRRTIWDPLVPYLEGSRLVLVVPDGELNRINFPALPVGETSYLIESGPLVHYLSAERDLAPPRKPLAHGQGLLALGGPDYSSPSAFTRMSAGPPGRDQATTVNAASTGFRSARSGCDEFRSMTFAALPASAREAEEVAAIWGRSSGSGSRGARASLLVGADATESALKATARGQRFLHLATHGFFLGGECGIAPDRARGIGGLAPATAPPRLPDNPLLLSGLALAGANRRDAAGPDEEDGILTAEEISALDLSGLDLAVLSACHTAAGSIRPGEGVFGLRRAFQVAGAASLVMALWYVDDEATRQWMRSFYDARLAKGLGTAEAVRRASLEALRARRASGASTDPMSWAAFVSVGDWR